MRNSHGEGRAQVVPRQETVDVIGSSTRSFWFFFLFSIYPNSH